MESQYTNRELDHYFKDIRETLLRQDKLLMEIKEQTTRTNGRVSSLEFWRNAIGWGFGIIMTVGLFIIDKINR